jgi:hypothetical protein
VRSAGLTGQTAQPPPVRSLAGAKVAAFAAPHAWFERRYRFLVGRCIQRHTELGEPESRWSESSTARPVSLTFFCRRHPDSRAQRPVSVTDLLRDRKVLFVVPSGAADPAEVGIGFAEITRRIAPAARASPSSPAPVLRRRPRHSRHRLFQSAVRRSHLDLQARKSCLNFGSRDLVGRHVPFLDDSSPPHCFFRQERRGIRRRTYHRLQHKPPQYCIHFRTSQAVC